ncbi:MAG TPA: L,D-transpeptidase family protein, partial [Gemmatimonadaceae bacterium]|nr:L,D-transpeptidase family protein [Gemmatimonadaceae bacterium]
IDIHLSLTMMPHRSMPVIHYRSPLARRALLVLPVALALGCKGNDSGSVESAQAWSPEKLASVKGVPAAEIEAAMQRKLGGDRPLRIDDDQWGHTERLYRLYGNNPLWLSSDGLHKTRTKALTDALLAANADGMRMADYPIGPLATAIAAVKQSEKPTAEQLATVDVILTASFVALGEDLLTGQIDPRTISQSWHVDPEEENVDSALVRNLRFEALDKALATMRPTDADYAGLSRELQRYRRIVAKGGWQPIPATKNVRPGESASPAVLAAVRSRLAAEGIVPASGPATSSILPSRQAPAGASAGVYDAALAAAVALYQSRHAINVDSALGKETIESMNVPAAFRLGEIAANMERFRWLPRSFGSRYVFVNVPAFRLEAYDGGKKTLEMRVIVGQEYEDRATPVFADSMETVVFRPYWNITPNIAAKEIFPKGPAYWAKENMETYREGGALRIRQRPGPKNALGFVKFLFPNDYNIYLHDTPNRELFKEDVRAFSHGCIRVEKPEELAQWVLGWDAAKVSEWMGNSPDNRHVKVPEKIPVYIAYFTAYINNNQLHFGNDLYSRNDKLVPEVMPGAMPSKEVVDAVQALRRIADA